MGIKRKLGVAESVVATKNAKASAATEAPENTKQVDSSSDAAVRKDIRELDLELIQTEGLQVRSPYNIDEHVGEEHDVDGEHSVSLYAAAMRDGDVFPPIVVFHDGDKYWLGDGHNRVDAATEIGRTTIAAEVRHGTRDDAIKYACGANRRNGIPMTRLDKRKAIAVAIEHAEMSSWSDRALAEHVGASDKTVGMVRKAVAVIRRDQPDGPIADHEGLRHNLPKLVAQYDKDQVRNSAPEQRTGKDGRKQAAKKGGRMVTELLIVGGRGRTPVIHEIETSYSIANGSAKRSADSVEVEPAPEPANPIVELADHLQEVPVDLLDAALDRIDYDRMSGIDRVDQLVVLMDRIAELLADSRENGSIDEQKQMLEYFDERALKLLEDHKDAIDRQVSP